MDLPNEMWFQIIIRLRCIDVFSLSVVSKRFHLLHISYPRYKSRLKISRVILGFDTNENFDVIMRCLNEISENIFFVVLEACSSQGSIRNPLLT